MVLVFGGLSAERFNEKKASLGTFPGLLKAMGRHRREIKRPLIGVVNSANEVVPGHIHLDRIAEAVKTGVRIAGGPLWNSRLSVFAMVWPWAMRE